MASAHLANATLGVIKTVSLSGQSDRPGPRPDARPSDQACDQAGEPAAVQPGDRYRRRTAPLCSRRGGTPRKHQIGHGLDRFRRRRLGHPEDEVGLNLRRLLSLSKTVPWREKTPGSFFPLATPRPWLSIWRTSRLRPPLRRSFHRAPRDGTFFDRWRPARMPSFFSISPGGASRRSFLSRTPSPSCTLSTSLAVHGRQLAPRLAEGRTACSSLTTTSSTTVASPGTSASAYRGKSCSSDQETGPIGHDQPNLVLGNNLPPGSSFAG
jgi:hypothetical protein